MPHPVSLGKTEIEHEIAWGLSFDMISESGISEDGEDIISKFPHRIRTLDSKCVFPKKKVKTKVYWSILERYVYGQKSRSPSQFNVWPVQKPAQANGRFPMISMHFSARHSLKDPKVRRFLALPTSAEQNRANFSASVNRDVCS